MSDPVTADDLREMIGVIFDDLRAANKRGDVAAAERLCRASDALYQQLTELLAAQGHPGALSVLRGRALAAQRKAAQP